MSYTESLIKIHEVTGVRIANDKVAKQLDKLDIHQQATRFFGEVCNQHLSHLISYQHYNNPVDKENTALYNDALFHTVRPVLNWLYGQRRLDPDKVAYLPYGVMPTEKIFTELATRIVDQLWGNMLRAGTLTSAYSKERRLSTLARMSEMQKNVPAEYLHAVTFHTGYSPTVPGRIRMRKVSRDTSTDNNFWMLPGFTDQDPVGYIGLYLPSSSGLRRVEGDSTQVYVVESEMSMLSAQEKLIEHSVPDRMFVASAGSNNETDMLFRAGYQAANLLMDHPDPALGRGEEQVKIRLSTAIHLQTRVFSAWDAFRGDVITLKDPDDVLQHYGWGHFRKYLIDEYDKSFVPADAWASERAIEEGLTVEANNILGRQGKAVEFGCCIRHPALLSAFVTRVSAALGIPQGPLRAAIVKVKDDEAGFIARIVETIRNDFTILYKESDRPGFLMMFHKAERRYVSINVNDGSAIVSAMSNIYGEMYSYFVDHVGLPNRREGEELLPASVAIRDGQRYIADYLKIAFQTIYQGVLSQEECRPIGAGIGYEEHPDDPDLVIAPLHAGDRWYRLVCDRRTDQVRAVELEGPIDGRRIFLPNQPNWSTSIRSVDDIHESNNISIDRLREIYFRICEMIDVGWKFRHQKQDVAFFAALIFVIAAGDAFDIKLILRIIGESNSGKSTLLSLLCRGQFPALQLVECAAYSTGYTLASLYLGFNRSTLAMILEEASQDTSVVTHKTKQLADISEMLRQVIYEGGANLRRFGKNGALIEYFVRTHVAMTSIQEARDVQDSNRSYILETVREESRRDPVITLMKLCSSDEIKKLRREIQLGVLRLIPRLRQAQTEIYKLLNEKQLASFQASTRFLRNFAPIGAVLQTLGIDWEPVVTQMIESRKDRLLSQSANSTSGIIYDKILRAPIVPVPNSRNAYLSVMQCVTMPNGYELLNGAGIGIIVNPNNWTLIVDFVAATSPGGAVYRMNDLNKNTPHQLKAMLDHHPDIARPHRYRELNVMEALAANNITALEYEISVLQIGRLRERVMAQAAAYTGVPMTGKTEVLEPQVSENNL
jgi:hypothetical protein